MYVGNKQNTGNDIERAGLTNGNLFGISVTGAALESRSTGVGAPATFTAFNKGNVENQTGAQIQTNSAANSVTEWLRPEDGAWDPRPGKQNDFYFVTTDRFNNPSPNEGRSRLYRLRFNDITNPEAGGTVDMILAGTEGQQMFDNMTIDSHGRILMQEDPGGNSHLAKVWLYDIDSGGYGAVAQFDSARFAGSGTSPFNNDEESSGIIDASGFLGDGWFLMDAQAHYSMTGSNATELVQGAQLLAMYVPPSLVPEPAAFSLLMLAGLPMLRRRR
jgi:MYXO-CTERM domain-containing protein